MTVVDELNFIFKGSLFIKEVLYNWDRKFVPCDVGSDPTVCVTFCLKSLVWYLLVPYKGNNLYVTLFDANLMSMASYNG